MSAVPIKSPADAQPLRWTQQSLIYCWCAVCRGCSGVAAANWTAIEMRPRVQVVAVIWAGLVVREA
jgi:hypothetical protein